MTRTATPTRPLGSIALVPVGRLELHPRNPRRDPGDVEDLANSIRAHGILEPLVVVPGAGVGNYLVVAGGRRLAAAKVAKLAEVPVLIREDLDEQGAAAAALVENLQREDLDAIQEAEAYRDLIALTGWQQKDLAKQLGIDPTTVSHALRLLEAPKVVQQAVRDGKIGAEHARAAIAVPAEVATKLPFRKGVTVEDFKDAAAAATEAHKITEQLRALKAKGEAEFAGGREGRVLTWGGEVYAGRERVSITKVLGETPKKIAGVLEGHQTYTVGRAYLYADGSPSVHDKLCECRAIAVVPREQNYGASAGAKLARVCVSPAGFAEYIKALRKADRKKNGAAGRGGGGTTKAEREKEKARKQRELGKYVDQALEEGRGALAGVKIIKANDRAKALTKLTRGGVDGEPLRLIVFALAHNGLQYEDGATPLLWEKVAKMSRRDLKARALELAAAHSLSVFGRHADQVQQAILEHYKVVEPVVADQNGGAE